MSKKLNEDLDSIFDSFASLFNNFQYNFNKVYTHSDESKQPSTDSEEKSSPDTTEIHTFKEFKDGKCVNAEKTVWKNGKIVDSSSETADHFYEKCDTNKCNCSCGEKVSKEKFDEIVLLNETLVSKCEELFYKNEQLENENKELKEQLNKIKSIFE